jgi:hypothetical protein
MSVGTTLGGENVGVSRRAPGQQDKTAQAPKGPSRSKGQALWILGTIVIVAYAMFPVLWIASLSLQAGATSATAGSSRDVLAGQLPRHLHQRRVRAAAHQLDRHLAHHDAHRRRRRGLRGLRHRPARLPRQDAAAVRAPRHRDVPAGVDHRPAVQHLALDRPLRHLARADPAVHDLRAAAGDLDAHGVLPRDPVRPRGGRAGRRRDAVPGLPQVIMPLALPGVFTSAIIVFIFCWNDFLFAISLTSTDAARTVPAATAFFTASSNFINPTGQIAAAAIVVTVPIIIMVLIFQRRIVAGLTAGAVKG